MASEPTYYAKVLDALERVLTVALDVTTWRPSAVLCAVEVVDEATARLDATIKPAIYFSAGIPNFWLADPTPPQLRIRCHRLRDGIYEMHTELVAGATTTVAEPVEITIDPALMLSKTRCRSTPT